MMEITDSQRLLLNLVQCALWRDVKPPLVQQKDFDEVMYEAGQQAVGALIADRIINSDAKLDIRSVARLMSEVKRQRQRNEFVDKGVVELACLLNGRGLHYVVFKGQVAAANYPDPLLRTSGDIDFYVAKDDFHRAAEVIEREWGVSMNRVEDDHHWSFCRDGLEYEMHYRAEMFGTKAHQQLFDGLVEKDVLEGNRTVMIGGTQVRVFSRELEVLHVFKHFFYHLLVEGVGLRQVCDFAVMLNAYKDLDNRLLRRYLAELGYSRAFDAVVLMAIRYLGLKTDMCNVIDEKRVSNHSNLIMYEVLTGGNFGRRNRKHHETGLRKSFETARIAFRHVTGYFGLARKEVLALSFLRIRISMRNITGRIFIRNRK